MKKLYLYGEIFTGAVDEKSVRTILDTVQDGEELEVSISSPGGDVFIGLAIYNMLLPYNATVKIISFAGSMASVIAMAGKTIQIAENAMMMIHNPWTYAWSGDENYYKKIAEQLAKIKSSILKAYIKKTGIEEAKCVEMMNDETWMTATEAIALKFADSIYKPEDEETKNTFKFGIAAYSKKIDISKYLDTKKEEPVSKLINQQTGKGTMDIPEEVKNQISKLQTDIDALTIKATDYEKRNADLEIQNKALLAAQAKQQLEMYEAQEKAFCQKLVAESKMKDDEVKDKVAKLVALRQSDIKIGDKTLYDIEVSELNARTPLLEKKNGFPPDISNIAEDGDDDKAQIEAVKEYNKKQGRT